MCIFSLRLSISIHTSRSQLRGFGISEYPDRPKWPDKLTWWLDKFNSRQISSVVGWISSGQATSRELRYAQSSISTYATSRW